MRFQYYMAFYLLLLVGQNKPECLSTESPFCQVQSLREGQSELAMQGKALALQMFNEAKKSQHDKCSSLFCPTVDEKEKGFITFPQDEACTMYAFFVTLGQTQ